MSAPSTPSTVQFIQSQAFVLSGSGSSIGDTSLLLQSFNGIDGTNIITADLGSFAFGTLEPGNGTQEEAILFTGVTQNANGTATLTGVSSVAFKTPYTVTSGLTKTHAGASKFILSNDAAFYNNFTLYLNAIAGAGAANASTTVKGIVQAATSAQINSATPTGSTGAILAITPDAFAASTNNQYTAGIVNTGIPYAVATGTSSAYTVTLASSVSTLASGTSMNVLFRVSNASGATLNPNGLGAKTLKKLGSTTLASGDITGGQVGNVVYDGTNFQVVSNLPPSTQYKVGNTTRDVSVNGVQNIPHGLGVTPKLIRLSGTIITNRTNYGGISSSIGSYDGTTQGCSGFYLESSTSGTANSVANNPTDSTSNILVIVPDTTAAGDMTSAVATFDSTNIILTWTKSSLPTGTANIHWEAIG